MIWKFAAAPTVYRSRFQERPSPEWLVLVPASLYGDDLDRKLRSNLAVQCVIANNGDVVYAGSSMIETALAALADADQRSAEAGNEIG